MVGSAVSLSEIVLCQVVQRMKALQRIFNCCVSLEVIDENGPTYYTSSSVHATKRLTVSEQDPIRSQEMKQTVLERRKEQGLLVMVPPHATKGE